MVRPIQFKFNFQKFLNLMAHLVATVDAPDVLKLVKMAYYIDKDHLIRFGTPVLGDQYVHMTLGPVASETYDLLKFLLGELPREAFEFPEMDQLARAFDVSRGAGKYPVFVAKVPADLEYFSETELESITRVIQEKGSVAGIDLSKRTHREAPHRNTNLNDRIDYRLFFEGEIEASKEAFELMELEQEDRDFASQLGGD